jgi:hypothetical protein
MRVTERRKAFLGDLALVFFLLTVIALLGILIIVMVQSHGRTT